MKVLVVDDERNIVKGIKFSLMQDRMEVDTAYDGDEALELFEKNKYDMVILDIMLPRKNGYEVCQVMRETSNVPIIMLTAKDSDMDKIFGLDYGADDYMTKPFNILELKARIKAILRRYNTANKSSSDNEESKILEHNGLRLEVESKLVFVNDVEVKITSKEYELLCLMMKNSNKVYSREMLLNEIWGNRNNLEEVRTVDVHVRRLREKIEENPGEPKYIFTKWGVGYYFKK